MFRGVVRLIDQRRHARILTQISFIDLEESDGTGINIEPDRLRQQIPGDGEAAGRHQHPFCGINRARGRLDRGAAILFPRRDDNIVDQRNARLFGEYSLRFHQSARIDVTGIVPFEHAFATRFEGEIGKRLFRL